MDPRVFQILSLASLALYGSFGLALELRPASLLAALGGALATEAFARRLRGESFDARSPMITALSLTLLLRTASPWLAALAACLAVGSKFAIRRSGGHVFNPANFAIVVLLLATDRVWVSSGQWGHGALLAVALVGAGQFVIHRAARSDVTWLFLAAWSALLFGRAAWLGDPWTIPWHQLQNGALLVFAFFMISDPRTTPRTRVARGLHAGLTASLGFALVFLAYEPDGLLFALFATAPLVPLLDRWRPGPVFSWAQPRPLSPVADAERVDPSPEAPRHDPLPVPLSARAWTAR